MILTDEDIIEYNTLGRPLIIPFNKGNLTPNGYDLSMDTVRSVYEAVELATGNPIQIPTRTHFKVLSFEEIKLPNDIVATLWLRSSYARKGIQATFGFVDAGFNGRIVANLYNTSTETLYIDPTEKLTFCQIIFEKLDSEPLANYNKRSGNYQNQKTLE